MRHLLQYVSLHPHLGLHFPYRASNYLSLETFTAGSFAPSGAHSHPGFAVPPQSKSLAAPFALEGSPTEIGLAVFCRSRAHSLDVGVKATKSFQHLLPESVADLTPILTCDNQAALAIA